MNTNGSQSFGRHSVLALSLAAAIVAIPAVTTLAEEYQEAEVVILNNTPYPMRLDVCGISWGKYPAQSRRVIRVPARNVPFDAYFDLGYDENGKHNIQKVTNVKRLRPDEVFRINYYLRDR